VQPQRSLDTSACKSSLPRSDRIETHSVSSKNCDTNVQSGDFGDMAGYDEGFLRAALFGYESEKAKIEGTIAQIRARLGLRGRGRPKAVPDGAVPSAPKRRSMSASARRRIAAAQRKRWAALKQANTKQEEPKQKHRLSAAGRKAIIEATKKRWAVIRAAKAKVGSKAS
jgi:hypothetical protein